MYLILTASPNADGLTAACGKAALEGVAGAGGEAECIDISAMKLAPCRICGNGWGTCRDTAACVTRDVLCELQAKIREAEERRACHARVLWAAGRADEILPRPLPQM